LVIPPVSAPLPGRAFFQVNPEPQSPPPEAPVASPGPRARTKAEILASLPQAVAVESPTLAAHRARLAEHRATAFIRYQPVIAGLRLRPVSLHSLDCLAAFHCDLGRGSFEDLAIFVWVHHPAFGQFAWFHRGVVYARLRLRLSTDAAFGAALEVAREQVLRARLDWPAGDDSDAGEAAPFSFAAQALDLFLARYPRFTAAEVLEWPLVELVQLMRAIIRAHNPRVQLMDSTEAAIIAAELEPVPAPNPQPPETAA